ncbi:type II secretion system protein [Geobacter sp. DSM 9736]|uniref:type II secretion system protein n=1 Tax=Geobacter sp. DSM 9736 TaxID=1277350 RepID=UPI000B50B481|nr:type II secretion system protein [Geobacter sp. DSM 9736]SNB47892.1 hypothetical protein SAMN06269301_3386 [Geobacter sp. DSM 9736]
MKPKCLFSTAGFTYIAALMMVVVMGIMLGVVAESWQMIMKREREEELLFRGEQIRYAIERWYKPRPGQHVPTPLRNLDDLAQDPRSLSVVKYLRNKPSEAASLKDPITGNEWEVVKNPEGGIMGVHSKSEAEPVKQKNFPIVNETLPNNTVNRDIYKRFEGKKKYSEWQFVYNQLPPAGSVTGLDRPFGSGAR